jgi:sulfur-oxidizing protein SoxB
MGDRISNLMHLKSGKPIDPSQNYVVAGWASVNEGTQGPPVWDLVETYVASKKVVRISPSASVKVVGG